MQTDYSTQMFRFLSLEASLHSCCHGLKLNRSFDHFLIFSLFFFFEFNVI